MGTKQKSFTLIELLVVIAIVGLLSSIVLVSTQRAREKARVAKGLNFSAQIYHGLGADIVGHWNFNENGENTCSDPPAAGYDDFCDSSGNNNHGKMNGTIGWVTDTPSGGGWASSSTGGSIEVLDNNTLDISGKAITIEVWVKFNQIINYQCFVYKRRAYYLCFEEAFGYLYFSFLSGGNFTNLRSEDVGFEVGKWHHFVGTYNGSKMKIFVDAKEANSRDFSGNIDVSSDNLYLRQSVNGFVEDLRIYEEGLSSAQIKKLYVEGAKKRGLLAGE